jgi:hypothetical protein
MSIEIDSRTGLPVVPFGWRWLVKRDGVGSGFYMHLLNKEGNTLYAYESYITATSDNIFTAAVEIYKEYKAERLYGHYPPNKIEFVHDDDF